MTKLEIELSPETERSLREEAETRRLPLEVVVREVVERQFNPPQKRDLSFLIGSMTREDWEEFEHNTEATRRVEVDNWHTEDER